MHRLMFIVSSALAAALMAASGATAQTPPQRPSLGAELETCERGPLAADRVTEFVGSMPARAGASRMRMRFNLERRRKGERDWRRIAATGFGAWDRSLPDRAGFIFHKRVVGLQVPASYRAVVRFAWERADGSVVHRARRTSESCRQPDLRPDLVPGTTLTGVPSPQVGLALYTLSVRNAGRSAAGPFAVRIGNGRVEVGPLAAGEQRSVLVLAPLCIRGSFVNARVDEERRVEESHEDGNGLRLACPLPDARPALRQRSHRRPIHQTPLDTLDGL